MQLVVGIVELAVEKGLLLCVVLLVLLGKDLDFSSYGVSA